MGRPQRAALGVVHSHEADGARFACGATVRRQVQTVPDVLVKTRRDADLESVHLPDRRHERPAQAAGDGQTRPEAPGVLEVKLQLFHSESPADGVT